MMKYLVSVALIGLWHPLSMSANWKDAESGITWTYDVVDGKARIGNMRETAISTAVGGVVAVPSTVNGYAVYALADYAFYGCESVTDFALPEGVEEIGAYAFLGCSGLREIRFPKTLSRIGSRAFAETSVNEVRVRDLYAWCRIEFSDSLSNPLSVCQACRLRADYGGYIEGDVIFPAGIARIPAYAFYNFQRISSATIYGDEIGACAFEFCFNLNTLTIPWSPASLKRIGEASFAYTALQGRIDFPVSLISIGSSAFWGTALETVTLQKDVREIGDGAFGNCGALTAVVVPSTSSCFRYCDGGLLLDKEGKTLVCCPGGARHVEIPDSVKVIGISAFAGCNKLYTVHLPLSLEKISRSAFSPCAQLEELYVPSGVNAIEPGAFSATRNLALVYVDAGDAERIKALVERSGRTADGIVFSESHPLPDLGPMASPTDISKVVEQMKDERISRHIATAAMYNELRRWVGKLAISATATVDDVRASDLAWASFALDAGELLETMPTNEDLMIEEFKPALGVGTFDLTVGIKNVAVGSGAFSENLKKVFGLEGAATLDAGAFKPDNVEVEFGKPENGKLKFTAKPKARQGDEVPSPRAESFFMRMWIK